MNHAIGIVAHHTRETTALDLMDTVKAATIKVDTGHTGPNNNHLNVWRHLAQLDTTWSIVLEDDAQPIPNFHAQLEVALDNPPTPIVSLYLGQQRPPQHQQAIAQALDKADANNAHWILADQLFHHVAVAIQTHLIPNMLNNTLTYLPIDENIGRWARHAGWPIGYTIPSLVDHADGPSLIHHPDQQPRPPGRKAWRTGSRPTWNTEYVEL